jgi:hypothetical protein
MSICAENTPWAEGTVGFFMAVDGVDKRFGVTARHDLFPPNQAEMKTLSVPMIVSPVTTYYSSAKQDSVVIQGEIDDQDMMVDIQERCGARIGREGTKSQALLVRQYAENERRKAETRKASSYNVPPGDNTPMVLYQQPYLRQR